MQNKANFLDAQMNVTSLITVDYEIIANCKLCENKPNTNPIKPNQSQLKPIKCQYKPKTNPKQTQNEPNQTQFQTAAGRKNLYSRLLFFIRCNKQGRSESRPLRWFLLRNLGNNFMKPRNVIWSIIMWFAFILLISILVPIIIKILSYLK